MKHLLVLTVVALIAAPVMADVVISEEVGGYAGHQMIQGGDTRGDVVYSNVTNGPTAGFVAACGSEIGDELILDPGGGLWDDVTFSVYNSSSSVDTLVQADLTVTIYNWDPINEVYNLAGGVFYDDVALGLAPGYYGLFSDVGLSVHNIVLADTILATLTYSECVWSGLSGGQVGQVMFDPPTVGSSTDDFYMDGSWYWFGGDPVANFAWEISIPEPASLVLLALAGLLIRRR